MRIYTRHPNFLMRAGSKGVSPERICVCATYTMYAYYEAKGDDGLVYKSSTVDGWLQEEGLAWASPFQQIIAPFTHAMLCVALFFFFCGGIRAHGTALSQ